MKKIILGAALLLSIGIAQAAPHPAPGTERNILSSTLPSTLQLGIKSAYSGYWITDLKAVGAGKRVKYMMTLENADQVLHLSAGRSGSWEVVDTTVKG
jgi:hypothetical protein